MMKAISCNEKPTLYLIFFKKWISPEHEIKYYDDIGIYPNNDLCPLNIYNMWIPFEMELKTDTYEKMMKD